ncbi:MFS transporter [Halovibrio variabilis]|nr:MFS transporter [Halovibrio variabilis]
MTNYYRELMVTPGVNGMVLAGLIARLPQAMIGLGLITMLSQQHGSYWLAGTVASTFILANAIIAPKVSKVIDKKGQSKVLPLVTLIAVLMLTSLVVAAQTGMPVAFYFFFAILAGVMPSIPALMRARWAYVFRDQQQLLHTALSLDSVITEMVYIIGPALAVALSTAVFPSAGPIAAIIMLAIGTIFFLSQKETEPKVVRSYVSSELSILKMPGIRLIVLILLAMGVIGGSIDVAVVAFSETQGSPSSASYILAFYALGSMIAGLAFGAVKIKYPIEKQFLIGILLSSVSALIPIFSTNIYTLTLALFIAGISFAPTMVIVINVGTIIIPSPKLTEGLTWMTTGIGIGVALGSAIAGPVIDVYGARVGFTVPVIAACIMSAICIAGFSTIRSSLCLN